jgi:hypothetical protein
MIPNQVNSEAHYVKGFDLNGVSSVVPVHLKVVVIWKDALNKSYKEYFDFNLDLETLPE